MKVYPIGYSMHDSSQRVEQLMKEPKTLLIDTRKKRYSWRSEWREEALMAKYGRRYRREGGYLGNLNHKNPGGPIRIADITKGLEVLQVYLHKGYDLILLCQCPSYDACHRKVITEELVKVMPAVQVIQPEQIAEVLHA